MFAYVKYVEDGCKEIVPTSRIKDFKKNSVNVNRIYWVQWREDFYKAQILILKETMEAVEEELAKGKRVRVPKLRESSPAAPPSEQEDAKAKNMGHKKAAEEAKKNNLLAILNDRKRKQKQSPLCPTPQKKMEKTPLTSEEEDDDDDDNDGVVPQKIYEEAKKKSQHYHKLYKGIYLQHLETKKKLEEQERHINELEAENKTIRQLNIELQQQLLRKMNCPVCPSPMGTPEMVAESGSGSPVEPPKSPKENKIDLGRGLFIRRETWARISTVSRDSLFVKELAVAIWGTKTLGERSLTGKTCPTTKTTRAPLTPEKLNTLKACFKEWLAKKNLPESDQQVRLGKAGRYITEKIMDVNKQKSKSTV